MVDATAEKAHVSIVICGHVDSGKSTTTGHLIFELGGLPERELNKLREYASSIGKSSFAFAFFMDRQKEERLRGVTITCTTKEFWTDNYHYTIIDAPGHRDFIKNMICGTAQADVAVLMVPACGGFAAAIQKGNHKASEVPGQTRQHSRLINLLGVKQIIVGINKMDTPTANYSEERYIEIRDEMRDMLVKSGWKKDFVEISVPVLPISGWIGDNLVKKSENMPWYKGQEVRNINFPEAPAVHVHTLVDCLNLFVMPPARKNEASLIVPLTNMYSVKGVGDVLAGRVEQGTVHLNREVVFVPTHTTSNPCVGKIFTIEMHHKTRDRAYGGDNVGLNIKNLPPANRPRAGDIMVYKDDICISAVETFTAVIQTLDVPNEVKVGYSPIAYVRSSHASCKIMKINWKISKETGMKKDPNAVSLKANETAEVVFAPDKPFVCDTFAKCEGLGRVAFLEGHSAIMIGRITAVKFK